VNGPLVAAFSPWVASSWSQVQRFTRSTRVSRRNRTAAALPVATVVVPPRPTAKGA
jgi:hypothetical protein